MKKTAFKLKSGNTTPFKQMGSSPVKQGVRNLKHLRSGYRKVKDFLHKMHHGTLSDPVQFVAESAGTAALGYGYYKGIAKPVNESFSKRRRQEDRKKRSTGENLIKTDKEVALGPEDM